MIITIGNLSLLQYITIYNIISYYNRICSYNGNALSL